MSALLLSLMLASRPTVAVEVHPDPFVDAGDHARLTAMRGWLVRRLLEEGYDVAAEPRGAQGVVRVRAVPDGLVVSAEGRARRSFAVEPGPDAVQRLEVLHRAIQGVEQACDAEDAIAEPEPGVALRFVDAPADDGLLEAMAEVGHHAGFTLSARPSSVDTLVCIERRGALAEVGIGPAADDCSPPQLVVELGDGSPDASRRAARQLLDALRSPPEPAGELDLEALGGPSGRELLDAPAPSVTRERDEELPPMHGPPRAEARLGASAGVAMRGRFVDPLVQAGWRMGRLEGVGGRLSASAVPSSGHSVLVVDLRLVIGPDWGLRVGRRGHLDVAALVGTDLHTFGVGDRTAGDVAFAAELPVTYSIELRNWTRLHLIVDPGIGSSSWEHRVGLVRESGVDWSRPAWRVGLAVGITHGWRIE